MTGLLQLNRERVQPAWIDYNNHLLDGYYLVIFKNATTALMDYLGLGEKERASKGHSLLPLETHLNYLREIKVGAETRVETQILGHNEKQLHVFHLLYVEDSPDLRATNEQMLINTDLRAYKPVPFLPEVLAKIEAVERDQANLPWPTNAGRAIALQQK